MSMLTLGVYWWDPCHHIWHTSIQFTLDISKDSRCLWTTYRTYRTPKRHSTLRRAAQGRIGDVVHERWFPWRYLMVPCGYGSIPINTIFSGMNIHLPAILMFTRVQGFDTLPCVYFPLVSPLFGEPFRNNVHLFQWCIKQINMSVQPRHNGHNGWWGVWMI